MLGHAPPPLAETGLDMRGGHPARNKRCVRKERQVEVVTPRPSKPSENSWQNTRFESALTIRKSGIMSQAHIKLLKSNCFVMLVGMTITNILYPLTKRYAGLSGQIPKIERKITEAERVLSTLPELRAEIAKKHDQMVHIAGLMREIDPHWDPKKVQPIRPHEYSLSFKYGDCTPLAYDPAGDGSLDDDQGGRARDLPA
jgi:hypothetical protein